MNLGSNLEGNSFCRPIVGNFNLVTYLFTILLYTSPVLVYGQFREIEEQQERQITFRKVRMVTIYTDNYQQFPIETEISVRKNFDERGFLTESRTFYGNDTTVYDGATFTYDTIHYRMTKTSISVNTPSGGSYSYQPHPRKIVELANEKGLLASVKTYQKAGVMKMIYHYDDMDLVKSIEVFVGRKLYWKYRFEYEFY